MSRIGRKEIAVPAGVAVTVDEANVVTVKGPKGTLSTPIHRNMTVAVDGSVVKVSRPDDERENRSLHGLSRTLIANMVDGVTSGYSKTLEIVGVGYRAAKSGKTLTLNLGHSHPILFEEKDGITLLDFKSDFVTKGQEATCAQRYCPQLEAYAMALETITGKKVQHKILWFFGTGTAYELNEK